MNARMHASCLIALAKHTVIRFNAIVKHVIRLSISFVRNERGIIMKLVLTPLMVLSISMFCALNTRPVCKIVLQTKRHPSLWEIAYGEGMISTIHAIYVMIIPRAPWAGSKYKGTVDSKEAFTKCDVRFFDG